VKNAAEKGVEKLRRAQLIDTDALRKLCKSATPGPWEQINHIVFTETGDLEWVVANARSGNSIIDAEYIAAANPAVVLSLLDEIDRLRKIEAAATREECAKVCQGVVDGGMYDGWQQYAAAACRGAISDMNKGATA